MIGFILLELDMWYRRKSQESIIIALVTWPPANRNSLNLVSDVF